MTRKIILEGDAIAILKELRSNLTLDHVEPLRPGKAETIEHRLASLEAYLEKREPMPFIVYDILIRFDDQRAIATLQIFA